MARVNPGGGGAGGGPGGVDWWSHTCPGAPELQAKASLSEARWLGPQQSGTERGDGHGTSARMDSGPEPAREPAQGASGRHWEVGASAAFGPSGLSLWTWGFLDPSLSCGRRGLTRMGLGTPQ